MLSSLKHKNIDSIFGFCNEVGAETIIYKGESRGRLENYLSDPMLLTWVKRLEVCVGLAHALSYIHYDETRDFSVIHQNISSYTVRLNNDWEPKQSVSDDQDNKYLAPVAIFHYIEKTLDGIIDADLWKQMDLRSLNIFAEIAYDCLNEKRSQRPNVDEIVTRLEKALELQLERENDELSVVVTEVEGTSSSQEEVEDMEFHYDAGRDFSVIHCNIRSSKILLDDKWEPKLSGFQLALKNTVPRRHRLLFTSDVNENVYLDPKYKKTGSMTHKSDVYSFGVVLFEVLCGRSAVLPDEELGEGLLSQLAKSHLDDMIDPHLREQMDPDVFKIFSETAYYCIQEERAKRPHIDQVVTRLDKALVKKRCTVAIKRINNQEGEEGFIAEIETLTSCKHENIISLLGFCYEGNYAMILVYEHASKGSLENYLGNSDKMTTLTWVQRLNICLDIAHGTYVYLDPEYQKDGKLSKKSDIYSFGVVLLEILTGRLAYDSVYTKELSVVVTEVEGTSSSQVEGTASPFTSTGVESNSSKKTMSSISNTFLTHNSALKILEARVTVPANNGTRARKGVPSRVHNIHVNSIIRTKRIKFRALAEILGLMRSDGIEIQRCYLDYLEALVSHYKAARSSRNPTGGYEGIRRFEDYHGDGNMDGSLAAKEKGRKERSRQKARKIHGLSKRDRACVVHSKISQTMKDSSKASATKNLKKARNEKILASRH
ncbi:kinase-like domain, phloem protein 2-like protein [Tanacetum coccineum]